MSRVVDKVVIFDGVFFYLSYIVVCEDIRVVMSRYDGLNEISVVLKYRYYLIGLRVYRVFLYLFNDASFFFFGIRLKRIVVKENVVVLNMYRIE